MTNQNKTERLRARVKRFFENFYPLLFLIFVISSLVFIGIYEFNDITHQSTAEEGDGSEREADEEWGSDNYLPLHSPRHLEPRFGEIAEQILEKCGFPVQQLAELTPEDWNRCVELFFSVEKNVPKIFDVERRQFLQNLNNPPVICKSDGCWLSTSQGTEHLLYERNASFDDCPEGPQHELWVAKRIWCQVRRILKNEHHGFNPPNLHLVHERQEQFFLEKKGELLSELTRILEEYKREGGIDNFEVRDGLSFIRVIIHRESNSSSLELRFSANDIHPFSTLQAEEHAIKETLKSDNDITLLGLKQEEPYHLYQISKQKLILAGLIALKLAKFHKVPFLSTFAAWLSASIFGHAPKQPPSDSDEVNDSHNNHDNHAGDFYPASGQESVISTPRNKNAVVLAGTKTFTTRFVFPNLVETLRAFGFSVYLVEWRKLLEASVLPTQIRRVDIRYNPENPGAPIQLSDISIGVTKSELPYLRSRLITDFQEIKRAASLFAVMHGSPSGVESNSFDSDPLRSPWNMLVEVDASPLYAPDEEPERITRTKSYLVCCLVAVAFLYHHGLPGVNLDFDALLNQCKLNTVDFHRSNSDVGRPLDMRSLNFYAAFYKNPFIVTRGRFIGYSCEIRTNSHVLFADKSLGLAAFCSDTYPWYLLRDGLIVDNVAGRYPYATWSIPSAGDFGAPVCDSLGATHTGLCTTGIAYWFDWNMALDMLGYTYIRNFSSTKDSLGFYGGHDSGYSIDRAYMNWKLGDTTQRCVERRFGGLWPNNLHFWTHSSFRNFSPFSPDNLIRVNIEAQNCPTTSEYSRVAIAGAENFGFLAGHGFNDPLAYSYPHIPQGVVGHPSTESHFRFNLRTLQGSLSARAPWYRYRLEKLFYGSGRNEYHLHPVPYSNANEIAVRNHVNPVNKLFRHGVYIERGNHLRQIEIAPRVNNVEVSDGAGSAYQPRNSVTISFSSPLRGEGDLKYKVIIPDAVKLRIDGRRIGPGYEKDISRWVLIGERPQFLGHPEGGVKGLVFNFDPKQIVILPRKHWHWDPEKLSRWYGVPEVETNLHWKYFVEIHVEGVAKNIDVPLIGNATRSFARGSLEVRDPLQMKWVWPLAPLALGSQPRNLQDYYALLRSPLYVLKNGQAFISSSVGTDDEVLDELSGGRDVSEATIERILSRTIQNIQDVFIVRIPIVPFRSKCEAVFGCQIVEGLRHCQNQDECLIQFCGKMMEVDDRQDQAPPTCANIDFTDEVAARESPVVSCDLMGASCCPNPDVLRLLAPCNSSFVCEERGPFSSYTELLVFKNNCQRQGRLFYPHCKANDLWTKCCEGDPACKREYRSRLVDGGCCEWLPNGMCRRGPAYRSPVWIDLDSGNYLRCGKLKLCGTSSCNPNTGNLTGGSGVMGTQNAQATLPVIGVPRNIHGGFGGAIGVSNRENNQGESEIGGQGVNNKQGGGGNSGNQGGSGLLNLQAEPVVGLPIHNLQAFNPVLNVANTANVANTTNTANTANTANVANTANTANTANVANTGNTANTANVANAANTANVPNTANVTGYSSY